MRGALGIVPGAALACMIACAASSQKMSAAPSEAVPMAPRGDSQHDEIARLDDENAQQREQLGLPAPVSPIEPGGAGVEAMSSTPVPPRSDQTCKPGPSDTCQQTCTLSNSICTNAKQICDLAKSLGNDAWANGKCTSNNQTCEAAKAKCCGCQ